MPPATRIHNRLQGCPFLMLTRRRDLDAIVHRIVDRIEQLETSVARKLDDERAQQSAERARRDEQINGLASALAALDRRLDRTGARLSELVAGHERIAVEVGTLTNSIRQVGEAGERAGQELASGYSQIVARLDGDFSNLFTYVRQSDEDLKSRLARASERIAGEVGTLTASVQRAEQAVAASFAQLVARFENDFGNLAEFTRRLDGDLASGLAQVGDAVGQAGQRAGEELASGYSQIVARLDSDFTNLFTYVRVASQERKDGLAGVAAELGRLVSSLERTDLAVGNGVSQIVSRFESDFGNLVEFARRLDQDLAGGLTQVNTRLNTDLVQLAANVNATSEAVGGGFTQLGGRLERDLGLVATNVHDVTETMRLNSS
ncbi:MAG TPA: hypothetical protein VG271_02300, partial [Beijerinckiaceae bacterium]|nr:hypothetical protein [Beijerinckiaceae bacterium]